jgi:hypothetical protein
MFPRAFRSCPIAWAVLPLAIVIGPSRLSAQGTASMRADSDAAPSHRVADSTADSANRAPLTFGQKAALYSSRTFSARALFSASYAAGLAQWRGTPKEWGAGMSGYARRDAAAYGGGVVRHTAEFGFGALLHEDPRFERSTRNGVVARTEDALRTAFVARTDNRGHRIAWSRAAAALATGFAVNSWEPRRLHSTHHALMLSLAGALSYPTATVTQEFTPDVRRFVLRKLHIGDR